MQKSSELATLIEEWFEAASEGDDTLVDRHVSTAEETRLIGSDPDEWIAGGEKIAAFLKQEAQGSGGRVTFTPSDIEAYEEGPVGWGAARLTITLPGGKQVSPRWSAVFHREDDEWKFVQTHASIPVANDQIGWQHPG